MKKILLLGFILISTKLFSFTLNVGSYVLDMNSSPVSNHTVYIEAHDSSLSYNYSNSTTTDSSGYYFFYVANVPSQNILFTISVYDCNNNAQYRYVTVSSSSPNAFQICVNSSPGCQAQFYYYPDTINQGIYHFINTSTNYVSNQWLVNSTQQSNQTNFTTSFQNPSLSAVCLIVNGQAGCSDSTCQTVLVHNCSNSFSYSANGNQVIFTATASPNPVFYLWTFGDGISQTTLQGSASHTYGSPGQYNVTLKTIDIFMQDSCIAFSNQIVSLSASNTGTIFGYVFADSNYLDKGVVELYEKNPVMQTFTLVDTSDLILDSATHSSYFIFSNKPYGDYYIKSKIGQGSSYLGSFYSTWYPNAINWQNANKLTLNSNQALATIILSKPQATAPPGTSSISGYINNMAGIPLKNELVFLMNQSKLILDAFLLDSAGNFQFINLAYGTYYLRPEITNINSLNYQIVLNAANPEITQLQINLDSNHFYVGYKKPELSKTSIKLFPNPASNFINLSVVTDSPLRLNVAIYNFIGEVIYSENTLSSMIYSKKISIDKYAAGLYFIVVSDGENSVTQKFIKQ